MITLNFDEVLKRVYNAKKGVEVRYGLGQGFEYCKQFADEAQGYATNAKASEKKATDAVAGIEQTKTDAVQAVQNAQTTATAAVQQAQSTATTAVTTKQTEAVQAVGTAQTGAVKAVDNERDAALQQVSNSTQAAETAARNATTAANAAGNAATAAGGYASSAESSATAASGSASAAATSESNAASSAQSAGTDADRAEAAAALAGTRANTDKTLKTENAPADAKATGDALAGKADSVVPHDLSIPITGWQTDTEVAEYPHYIDITADVTSTTVVSVSIDPASADVAGKAMLVNPETRTGAIRIRAHNIPTAEISARWYPIKYGGQFYGDGSIYSNFLLAAHPVGSIYQTISHENPSVTFGGGTWEKIAQDRVLMGASDTHPAGTTVEAGLPNITGNFDSRGNNTAYYGVVGGSRGAFSTNKASGNKNGSYNVNSGKIVADDVTFFDASRSSSVYGNSDTVQPPAYFTYIWLRTD